MQVWTQPRQFAKFLKQQSDFANRAPYVLSELVLQSSTITTKTIFDSVVQSRIELICSFAGQAYGHEMSPMV